MEPSEIVAWARERGKVLIKCIISFFPHFLLKVFDMILVISDSCTVVKAGLKEELIKYRLNIYHQFSHSNCQIPGRR